jgi:hypothetical protein
MFRIPNFITRLLLIFKKPIIVYNVILLIATRTRAFRNKPSLILIENVSQT